MYVGMCLMIYGWINMDGYDILNSTKYNLRLKEYFIPDMDNGDIF